MFLNNDFFFRFNLTFRPETYKENNVRYNYRTDQSDGISLLELEERNPSVAEVHDGNEAVSRDGDSTGPVQLAGPGAVCSELLHENSRGGENLW